MNAQTKIEAAPSLAAAYVQAFAEIEAATKDKENPAFKAGGKVSKYADLGAVIDAIKPALIKHGLFFIQRPVPSDGGVSVQTIVGNGSGETMDLGTTYVPANKNDAQAHGSAMTYARRYGLQTGFGVPTEDDDGNAAVAAGQSSKSAVSPPSATPRNWGGRYPTMTALKAAMHHHHAELERMALESTFDDLEGYLTSPEYVDYVKAAGEHAPYYLEGERHPNSPPEFVQTFTLEQKARDMIALRGGRAVD